MSTTDGAVPLILGILKETPTSIEAVRLLNRAAETMLAEAEAAYAANNAYLARNILEEIFAFHPRHGASNERWVAWTGLPPRVPPATAPTVGASTFELLESGIPAEPQQN